MNYEEQSFIHYSQMQIHEITCQQTFKRLIFHENGPTHILMIPQYMYCIRTVMIQSCLFTF